MYRIPDKCIKREGSLNLAIPKRVDINCPFCGEKPTFTVSFTAMGTAPYRFSNAPCSYCEKTSLFFWLCYPKNTNDTQVNIDEIYIHPSRMHRSMDEDKLMQVLNEAVDTLGDIPAGILTELQKQAYDVCSEARDEQMNLDK